jgi:hypothetical protein
MNKIAQPTTGMMDRIHAMVKQILLFICTSLRIMAHAATVISQMMLHRVMVIIHLPDATHDVPHERPIMGFIVIPTAVFQIMPDGRVHVAVGRNALLPVVISILGSALLEVLGDFEDHSFVGAVVGFLGESTQSVVKVYGTAGILEVSQAENHIVAA